MSDLQLALLGLGAVVIAGVVVYNAVQERRAGCRAEKAFGAADPVDVLLAPDAVRDDARREPTLGELPADAQPAPDRLADVHASEARPGRDSVLSTRVDTIATVAAP